MKKIVPFFITLIVVLLFYVKRFAVLKIYPPLCNLFFFLLFFISLFTKETVIQKIAKAIDGGLTEEIRIYTRKLTYIWCIFTFLNFLISVATIFMSDEIWMLYNGCISYVLMGILFLSDIIYRKILKKEKFAKNPKNVI